MKAWKSNSAGDRKGIFKVNQNQKTKAQAQAQEYRQAQTTDMKLKIEKAKTQGWTYNRDIDINNYRHFCTDIETDIAIMHIHSTQTLIDRHTNRRKQLCIDTADIETLMHRHTDRHKQLCRHSRHIDTYAETHRQT